MKNNNQASPQLVWDIPVRIFHWLLVFAIAAQWFTAEQGGDWLEWHFYIGYITIGLIVFRLVWGLVGTRYARFSDFIPSPKSLIRWLKGEKKDYVGHPPLGGLMVLFLLLTILIQGVSGLFTTDDIFTDGPWRAAMSSEMQDYADWIHGNLFTVIQVAVALHIAAAFYYLLFRKANLIKPLITGKKLLSEDQGVPSSKLVLALIVLLLVTALIYLLVSMAPAPVEEDYY